MILLGQSELIKQTTRKRDLASLTSLPIARLPTDSIVRHTAARVAGADSFFFLGDAMSRKRSAADDALDNGSVRHVDDSKTTKEPDAPVQTSRLSDLKVEEPPAPAGIPPTHELSKYKAQSRVTVSETPRPSRTYAIDLRKPTDQEYVRTRSRLEVFMDCFKLKENGRLYLFLPEIEPYLKAKHIRQYRMVLCMPFGAQTPFIWPLVVPLDDMGRVWHESAQEAAKHAETEWIQIHADKGCYVAYSPPTPLPEPVWPEEDFFDLVDLAFKNSKLDSLDHPVLKRLRGEVV
jgi:hypothetical protein